MLFLALAMERLRNRCAASIGHHEARLAMKDVHWRRFQATAVA